MNPFEIIEKYYDPDGLAYQILVTHSELVLQKALAISEKIHDNKHDRALFHRDDYPHRRG